MNYNINEDLLELECFEGLKRGNKTATLVVLSFILHWTKIANEPTAMVYQKKLANVWSLKPTTIAQAIKRLQDCGLIKCVKPWQRVGAKPGQYIVLDKKGSIPLVTEQYTRSHRAVASRDTVNNYNNNYKEDNSSYKESSPDWMKSSGTSWETNKK